MPVQASTMPRDPDQGVQLARVLTPRPGRLLHQLCVRVLAGKQEIAARLGLELAHAHLKAGMERCARALSITITADSDVLLLLELCPVDGDDDLAHLLADVAPVGGKGQPIIQFVSHT